jgi:dTDP-4-amino-4,6-dideoxygalactose transaminase
MFIPFNKPYLSGEELVYIKDAIDSGHISGNGDFTRKCHQFFERRWGFKKCLLTTSCTDALEMCAILLDIKPGDEVIIPSYTFVSTALAFVRQGAIIRFIDSRTDHPGLDEKQIESVINSKTKAMVAVHYAGVACDMDTIMAIAEKHNLYVIEDAAHSIDSYYKGKVLGSIGNFGCFSFHETKNIQCGEGGMLVINDERFLKRAEIIWEKGTNRAAFFRGEVNKYGWLDTGSSFLPSDITAAFLYAQLQAIDYIQKKRKELWNIYYKFFMDYMTGYDIVIPFIPDYAVNNGHLFYIVLKDLSRRDLFISSLKERGIWAIFHYQALHVSNYYKNLHDGRSLKNSMRYTDCLVRLPLFMELEIEPVLEAIKLFLN